MISKGILRLFIFGREVYIRMRDNELVDMANALSFKLILSIFPFIIFFMSCIAFLNLDVSNISLSIGNDVPSMVKDLINLFVEEVVVTKRISLLSSSLLVSLFSASSGLYTLMKGLNRAYGVSEKRGYIFQRIISLFLVVILTGLIILSLYVCIFSDKINELVFGLSADVRLPVVMVNLRSYLITAALIFVMIILIYMLALVNRPSIRQLVPGTLFTMAGWLLLSKVFNIYVNNFSRYSTVYGSIGAIFVFALWLNLISYDILIGGQINAIICDRDWMKEVLFGE